MSRTEIEQHLTKLKESYDGNKKLYTSLLSEGKSSGFTIRLSEAIEIQVGQIKTLEGLLTGQPSNPIGKIQEESGNMSGSKIGSYIQGIFGSDITLC